MEESGPAEERLHAELMKSPRRAVSEAELEAIEDADARDNYRILLRFRERLLGAGTIEACYMNLFKSAVDIPPLFIEQLVHVILRNVLDGAEDPLRLRAAELFFREQKATIKDGHALLADLETVEMHASGSRYGSIGRLIVEAQADVAAVNLDVLDRANADVYWQRESRHDTVISMTYGRAALDALAFVIDAWVRHFLGVEARSRPIREIPEERWQWHIGLDAESTAILNELWKGGQVDAGRMRHILALFRMELGNRFIYLALSADDDGIVKMKPQNLLSNLPINEA